MVINGNFTVNITCYSNYFLLSRDPLFYGSAKQSKKEIMLTNRKTEYNGFMSPATKRKVRTILTTWLTAVKEHDAFKMKESKVKQRRLTFATLTISESQKHDDNFIKRNMLNKFLINVKRKFNVKYYFWRAEKQKNGNIHFHLILDTYISNVKLQAEWNEIQKKAGYLDKFFKKNNRHNAPSTDIRQVADLDKSIDYVMKYVSKNPDDLKNEKLKVNGRIWGCSDELRKLKPYSFAEDSGVVEQLYVAAKKGQAEVFEADFFTIYKLDTLSFLEKHSKRILNDMRIYYRNVYIDLYIDMPIIKKDNIINVNPSGIAKPIMIQQRLDFGESIKVLSPCPHSEND